MKKINIFAVLAAVIALVGDFVPYYYSSWYGYGSWHQYTTTLFTQDILGILVLLMAALMILFALIRKRVPLIISTIVLMIAELIYIFVALDDEVYVLQVPETGLLLLPGFYMAVAAVVLSLISIIRGKKFSNN